MPTSSSSGDVGAAARHRIYPKPSTRANDVGHVPWTLGRHHRGRRWVTLPYRVELLLTQAGGWSVQVHHSYVHHVIAATTTAPEASAVRPTLG